MSNLNLRNDNGTLTIVTEAKNEASKLFTEAGQMRPLYMGLIITGALIGGCLLIAGIMACGIILTRRKSNKEQSERAKRNYRISSRPGETGRHPMMGPVHGDEEDEKDGDGGDGGGDHSGRYSRIDDAPYEERSVHEMV